MYIGYIYSLKPYIYIYIYRLKTISPLIKFKTNYVEMLDTTCINNNYPPPVYTVLSSIKHEHKLESHYSIQCEAMDFVAIGT